jgi:fluoroquinolone transport system permease protein
MTDLWQLLKWDIVLLSRNRLFILAAAVAGIYIALFYLLKPLGNLTTLLIILIFNDPVVTGYLFASVLLIFDKNQHTLQAISVLPLPFRTYLLSKAVLLALLATVISFVMAFATRGTDFNAFHLLPVAFLSAFMFALSGFTVGALTRNFNQLLLYSVPFFILTATPFLPLFGYGELAYYFLVPSAGGIGILQAAFEEKSPWFIAVMYMHLLTWTAISWVIALKVTSRKLL